MHMSCVTQAAAGKNNKYMGFFGLFFFSAEELLALRCCSSHLLLHVWWAGTSAGPSDGCCGFLERVAVPVCDPCRCYVCWSLCYCLVSVMVEVRPRGLFPWKSKPAELIKWLVKESQAQLSPKPSVLGILNWEAAGVTEAALLQCAHRSGLWTFPVST